MRYLLTLFIILTGLPLFAQKNDRLTIYDSVRTRFRSLGATPCFFTEFMDKLYFMADDGEHGFELWRLGKTEPPAMIGDLYSGTASGGVYKRDMGGNLGIVDPAIRHMAVAKDGAGKDKTLYLQGNDGSNGWELYKYDPAMPMPALAYEFVNGPASLDTTQLFREAVNVKNKIYFPVLSKGIQKMIEYDPASNKVKILDSSEVIRNLTGFGEKLYYSTKDSVRCYDPVAMQVKEIAYFNNREVDHLHAAAGRLFIGVLEGSGGQLFQYDGINAPVKISEYCMASYLVGSGGTRHLSWTIAAYNNKVYYPCPDNGSCWPCEYDIAKEKARRLSTDAVDPICFVACGAKIFFSASDPVHGQELWSYNGVTPPVLEIDIMPGKADSGPYFLTAYKDELYFVARSPATGGVDLMRYSATGIWPAAVSNVMFTGKVNTYPNPATDLSTVTMELTAPATLAVKLYDATGRVVYRNDAKQYVAGKHGIRLDLHDLPVAVYHIQLLDDKGTLLYAGKLVKQ